MNFHIFGFMHSDGRRVRLPGRFTDSEFDALTVYGLPVGVFCWHLHGDNDIRIPLIEKLDLEEHDVKAIMSDHINRRKSAYYVESNREVYSVPGAPLIVAIADRPGAYKRMIYKAAKAVIDKCFPYGNGRYCLDDVLRFEAEGAQRLQY